MHVNIKLTEGRENARPPTYSSDGAGAFDFYATEDLQLCYGAPVVVRTGVEMEVPNGYSLLITSRSGHGFKHNTRLGNCLGVIDSDYRGEIFIKLTMDFPSWQSTLDIRVGDRVAQGFIIETPRITLVQQETLSATIRGSGGLGSTGT